jgi:predicted TIM-barrel fold metal-dependent hydrolase
MIGETLVVDAVVHALNMRESNITYPPMAGPLRNFVYGLHAMLSPANEYRLPPDKLLRDWQGEVLGKVLFLESDVDLAVYHSLPLQDFLKDGGSALEKGIGMRRRSPQRVHLHPAIDPLEGENALAKMEDYVKELGAIGIKIYPARYRNGQTIPIRLNDPKLGIPVIEKAHQLGVRCIAVHKAFPIGPVDFSVFGVSDVEVAGRFPEMNFEVLHPGFAFLEETSWLLARYPNVYVNLEWTMGLVFSSPRRFAEILGTVLQWGGEDRIFWASGCMSAHPQPTLEAFWAFQMPDDLMKGYGFPPLTETAKRKIVGENWCRMHGLDMSAAKAAIENDHWARERAAGRHGAWAALHDGAV